MTDTSTAERDAAQPPPAAETSAPANPRRELFSRLVPIAAGVAGAVVLAACDVVDAPFDRRHHLARRLTFGANHSTIDRIESIGEAAWVDEQLDPASLDTAALDALLAQLPALEMTAVELSTTYPNAQGGNLAAAQLKLAALIRAAHSPAQLYERMVEFWSDHFNVPADGNNNQQILKIVEDRTVIRPNALGKFSDLLVASAQSPAMLLYLDNFASQVNGINENYARELLELHSLGVNGGYTEDDVVNTARLLTGWSINPNTGLFRFQESRHDDSPMTIRGWQRPTTGSNLDHGVAFLRHLAEQAETAQFVCSKMARRFVADDPDQGLIDAMANAWLANDSAIEPVMRAMIDHSTFDDAAPKFQRPFDFFSMVVRAVDGEITPSTNLQQLTQLGQTFQALGQVPFEWPAPDGYPDTADPWLNSGSLFNRWNLVGDIVSNAIGSVSANLDEMRSRLTGLGSRDIYDEVAQTLLAQDTTDAGAVSLHLTTGWTNSTNPSPAQIDDQLPIIVITLLASADAQYR